MTSTSHPRSLVPWHREHPLVIPLALFSLSLLACTIAPFAPVNIWAAPFPLGLATLFYAPFARSWGAAFLGLAQCLMPIAAIMIVDHLIAAGLA